MKIESWIQLCKLFTKSFFLIFLFLLSCSSKEKKLITKGILDLSNETIFTQTFSLDGEWEFYYKQLLTSQEITEKEIQPTGYVVFPGTWKGFVLNGEDISGTEFATFRAKIKVPTNVKLALKTGIIGVASQVYINGALVQQAGKVGKNETECSPGFKRNIIPLEENKAEHEIILQICNYSDPRGGVWDSLELSEITSILVKTRLSTYSDVFIASILFIMGIYHVILFALRRKDLSPLFFGGFCLSIGIRALLTSERILHNEFPNLSWNFLFGLEYASFFVAIPLFYSFAYSLYKENFVYEIFIFAWIVSVFYIALVLFTKPIVYASFADLYRFFILLLILYFVYAMIKCLLQKKEDSLIFFAGLSIIILSGINDILVAQGILHNIYLAGYGLFFFLIFQSTLIAVRFSRAFKKVEELYSKSEQLTLDLIETNFAISRFVPSQFMNFLKKDNIKNLHLGDFLKKEVTVFFSDIRGFTSLSEKMESDEVFKFLNSYFHRTISIINKHHGFVDKILGDGTMAIFPDSPQDAVDAALEIQNSLTNWNKERKQNGLQEIRVGIGIHLGVVSIGAVGIEERLDTTVIGDPVNVAARLESMTKEHNQKILISETVYENLNEQTKSLCKEIETTQIRGKTIPIKIYAIQLE